MCRPRWCVGRRRVCRDGLLLSDFSRSGSGSNIGYWSHLSHTPHFFLDFSSLCLLRWYVAISLGLILGIGHSSHLLDFSPLCCYQMMAEVGLGLISGIGHMSPRLQLQYLSCSSSWCWCGIGSNQTLETQFHSDLITIIRILPWLQRSLKENMGNNGTKERDNFT